MCAKRDALARHGTGMTVPVAVGLPECDYFEDGDVEV